MHSTPSPAESAATSRARGGGDEATLIGESDKVSVSSAIIANETMVRYLDFNDVLYFPKSPGKIGGAHPSDALPAALAVGERQHASGKQVIEAMVAAYETIGRMVDASRRASPRWASTMAR